MLVTSIVHSYVLVLVVPRFREVVSGTDVHHRTSTRPLQHQRQQLLITSS